jgi:hypothetical protein
MMMQGELFAAGAIDSRKPGISWQRYKMPCRSEHQLLVDEKPTSFFVAAAQHPTCLRPYCVEWPTGEISERKYSLLVDAKAAAIAAWNDWCEDHFPATASS